MQMITIRTAKRMEFRHAHLVDLGSWFPHKLVLASGGEHASTKNVDAVRRDLGYRTTSRLRGFEYEPLIEADHEDSAV